MAPLSEINVGTAADDGTGDAPREVGTKINGNLGLIASEVGKLRRVRLHRGTRASNQVANGGTTIRFTSSNSEVNESGRLNISSPVWRPEKAGLAIFSLSMVVKARAFTPQLAKVSATSGFANQPDSTIGYVEVGDVPRDTFVQITAIVDYSIFDFKHIELVRTATDGVLQVEDVTIEIIEFPTDDNALTPT